MQLTEQKLLLQPIHDNGLIKFAIENIPLQGILTQTEDGFVFLKISNEFIYSLFPLLDVKEKNLPPYFSEPYDIGAHVSVIYKQEIKTKLEIKELGSTFIFKINNLYKAYIENKTFFILTISSPSLIAIRKAHGFSENPVYHDILVDWHITIATG